LFLIFLSVFARTSIGNDPMLHSARRSALYMTQRESNFGPCFVLVSIFNKFLSLIVLLIVTSVCLFHRRPLSNWTPRCFPSLASGILVPNRNRSGATCFLFCLVKFISTDFAAENLILHFLLHLLILFR
jgi:hypothetical protein